MKLCFSISTGSLVITTGNILIKVSVDVDAVLWVELEEDKVAVTGWNSGSSVSTGDLVKTTGTVSLGYGLAVLIGDFVTTCSLLSVLST